MSKLTEREMLVYNRFSKFKNSVQRCKVNQVNLTAGRKHNLVVLRKCLELYEKGHNFLTEAYNRNFKGKFRHDIVDLTTGEVFEVKDSSINKDFLELSKVRKDFKVIEV